MTSALARPALLERLDGAFGARLTLVTAGAGFGKSTLLAEWVADLECAWCSLTAADQDLGALAGRLAGVLGVPLPAVRDGHPADGGTRRAEALAAALSQGLQERLRHDLVLVLDDVHEIEGAAGSARLIESLCRQAPEPLRLVLSSRTVPPFAIERLRGHGQVNELAGDDLAFTAAEVGQLLERSLGASERRLAEALHAATGGWPAAVRLALEALGRATPGAGRARALEALGRRDGPLFAYIAAEVFDNDPQEVRELLRHVAPLERFSAELCTALGLPRAALGGLMRRGLVVRAGPDALVLHALVRDHALQAWPLSAEEERDVHRRAAAWLLREGSPAPALGQLAAAGAHAELAGVLRRRGAELLAQGHSRAVLDAATGLARDAGLEQLLGEAHAVQGEVEPALACFRRALGERGTVPASLGWRMMALLHLRGDLDGALDVYARCAGGPDGSKDHALLLAWAANATCRRGRLAAAGGLAERALAAARLAADDQALVAAHLAVATVAEADGRLVAADRHLREALAAAERGDDLLQLCRVRNCHGSLLLGQGLYREAIEQLDLALGLAELLGCPNVLALALMNRGLCRWCRGELDEANADYESAVALYAKLGTHEISYALIGRGDVHRERGDLALARAFYEQGLAIAEESGDHQGLVPALYQLAKVLVDDEPDRAAALAERAVACGWPDQAWALNACGWIALARGETARAAELARRAEAQARARGDRFGLAESLELATFSSPDPPARLDLLREALAIWRELDNPLREAVVELALGRLSGGVAGHAAAARTERRLQRLGVRVSAAGPAGLLRTVAREAHTPLAIETLGGFRIRRANGTVALAEWRSKKARTLLKLLVSRAGHPVPRELVMDALWPDEDPATLGNRLSVALSAVRAVLDPERRFAAGEFISTERDTVSLVVDHAAVDVHVFLHDASAGLALHEAGRHDDAVERLRCAEAAYVGDYLEEDLYEPWASPLRERARSTYVAVARALAREAEIAGEHHASIDYQLRILERDGLDEHAHLGLVLALTRAGRHGDARRRYRDYCSAMGAIGVEAAPFGTPPGRRAVAV